LIMLAGVGILILGYILDKAKINVPVISNLYWLSAMNFAFATGTIRFLFGHERKLWTQTSRPDAAHPATQTESVPL
jgi:hypothetical protein